MECVVCGNPAKTKGMCSHHYQKHYRGKSVAQMKREHAATKAKTAEEPAKNLFEQVQEKIIEEPSAPVVVTTGFPKRAVITVFTCSDGKEFGTEIEALRWELDVVRGHLKTAREATRSVSATP